MKLQRLAALALAGAMTVSTMGMTVFAEDGFDKEISVTGVNEGDTAVAYQIISWDADTGAWVINKDLGLPDNVTVETITDGISAEEAKLLANAALKNKDKLTSVNLTADSSDSTRLVGKLSGLNGLFYVLVMPSDATTLYNPVFVSSDMKADNETNTIAATAGYGDGSAVVKKKKLTFDKKSEPAENGDANQTDQNDDNFNKDYEIGAIVPFQLETQIPMYLENTSDSRKFEISDQLSAGLELVDFADTTHGLVIKVGGAKLDAKSGEKTNYTVSRADDGKSFTITFAPEYLGTVLGNPDLVVTYAAKVTNEAEYEVNEDTNEATLKFTHNPGEKEKELKDHTHHYTFDIDGKSSGQDESQEQDVIKVGVDEQGKEVKVYTTTDKTVTVKPLEGAEFELLKVATDGQGNPEKDEEGHYKTTSFSPAKKTTTNAEGLMNFKGLDAGTYILKETKAPAGYVKDAAEHVVKINATYRTFADDSADGWDTVLDTYTITIDGQSTATYQNTNQSDHTTVITRTDNSQTFPVNNVKGSELPSTGGRGTTIFYAVGVTMIFGAAVILIARRKSSEA